MEPVLLNGVVHRRQSPTERWREWLALPSQLTAAAQAATCRSKWCGLAPVGSDGYSDARVQALR